MFCNQCEQTAKGQGCTAVGVCGKKPEVANLQNLVLQVLKGLSLYAVEARKKGISIDGGVNRYMGEALFSTVTNVNFDPESLLVLIRRGKELAAQLSGKIKSAGGNVGDGDALMDFSADSSLDALVAIGEKAGNGSDSGVNPDIRSLQQTMLYGLKGASAYIHHACVLGKEDLELYGFMYEALAALTNRSLGLDEWVALTLNCGKANLRAMELLDEANTGHYGHPVPTKVSLGLKKGKCILVSGHDLGDLEKLLQQTAGKGINIYTHGEMLPAHSYPRLKSYSHLCGHYGTAWQNQRKEFADFPGAILITTNCIQSPDDVYFENIFTTGPVAWPGVKYIADKDFRSIIGKALALPGFAADEDKGFVMTGFARNAVLGVADKVIDAVKSGAIKHIFLVGGCDGAKPGRSYYTDFVEKTPPDSLVLTLACGKFRFFDQDLGTIGGIPRLLDVGQCNDAFSAIQIAVALAEAFGCGVNDLPLSLVLSWYEQKAVAILLTLLHLNIKNIRIGPSLPAFITPNVLNVLVENFAIKPISTPDEDLSAILSA